MLTQRDLDEIEKLFDEKFAEKAGILPTKDEFYKMMDEVMGELKDIRQELTMHSGQHVSIDDQRHFSPLTKVFNIL